jgi:hypothetical protein
MANGHGGYRKPANPAPVSGPGALSRRTDGKQPMMPLTDAAYGEQKTMQEIQGGAPMAQVSGMPPQQAGPTGPPVVGMGEPSMQPDVPVTNGAQYGPGGGPEALGIENPLAADASYLAKYLPVLLKQADDPRTPPGYKRFVRTVIANMSPR